MMNIKNRRFAQVLTYCGTLPLVAGAIARASGFHGSDVMYPAMTYGAVIIAFLCGIHWAVYLFFSESCPLNLFLVSNSVALLAWLSLLLQKNRIALLLEASCFLLLLMIDHRLAIQSIIPRWFYQLRRNATGIVVLSLILLVFVS